ncbi:MAG: M3 family oligoendopeptidase [Planctomycetota bacterium]|nr:M3 family oligoendopeptidase [Planctomycetota bacterium]
MTDPQFSSIRAATPDYDAIAERYRAIRSAYDAAPDASGRAQALEGWEQMRRELSTWGSLVGLRFQQDTRDVDRKAALKVRDELSPRFQELETGLMRRIAESPDAAEVGTQYGPHLLELWRCAVGSYDPSIEAESVAESGLASAYTELVSSAQFEFEGETLNLSQLSKYAQHADRDLRYRAAKVRYDWFEANATELDRIYDELVKVRATQARKLGLENFIELGYRKLGRTDYNSADVARYRDAVRDFVVPLCTRIRERQRESLGVEQLMTWDESVHDVRGNPTPQGDHDWMVERAREMFDAMGPELGGFYRRMLDGEFLDLKSRQGKAGGGFCTSFPTHGMPFIFANFNGTQGDVRVFTHEMGHAFQNYSSRNQSTVDYFWPTAEAAEVHSMSLEFLTYPHMEKFFGADADRFRRIHLTEALTFLPYGVAVDHFQHLVYENPEATPAERLAMWQEMERTYLPHRAWGDLKRPRDGGMWQGQMHIYHVPFYYIDYTLAQVCALQFWVRAETDRAGAMKAYRALCARGGEAPFQDLVRSAGLVSPFDAGCLDEVVATAGRALDL